MYPKVGRGAGGSKVQKLKIGKVQILMFGSTELQHLMIPGKVSRNRDTLRLSRFRDKGSVRTSNLLPLSVPELHLLRVMPTLPL